MGGTPILVVVGGLPATGKSTVASTLARLAGFAVAAILATTGDIPDHVPADRG